jgi:Stage II sporulation protein E (SpoIIE)
VQKLLASFERLPPAPRVALLVGLVLALGIVDYATGRLFSFAVFYLLPVAAAAWVGGRRLGNAVSALSALTWFAAEFFAPDNPLPVHVVTWNALVSLGFFLAVAAALASLRAGVDREARVAHEIQQGLLPRRLPDLAGYETALLWRPARELGGDYLDALDLDGGGGLFCVGDVAGKGVTAALLMSNLQAAIRSALPEAPAPAATCARVNRLICANTQPGRFITFFLAHLDTAGRRLRWANAGHPPALLVHARGDVERLSPTGPALGVFPDATFTDGETVLAPGDRLVLYTDGVTEAHGPGDEEFGEERLVAAVSGAPELAAGDVRERVLAALTRFGGRDFEDDVSLLVLRVEPTPPAAVIASRPS